MIFKYVIELTVKGGLLAEIINCNQLRYKKYNEGLKKIMKKTDIFFDYYTKNNFVLPCTKIELNLVGMAKLMADDSNNLNNFMKN